MEYELPDVVDADGQNALSKLLESEQRRLHLICYKNFEQVADTARLEKLKDDKKSFRFYKTEYGEFPSVTTIIDPEFKAWCSEEELKIATSEGNIHHALASEYIKTGKWVEYNQLDGVANDLMNLKGIVLTPWDFPKFLEKYPLKNMKNGRILINKALKYAGTNDGECLYPIDGLKDAELVPTIFDFKRTPDRDKNFTQMAAYASCEGMEHIKQMMVIPTGSDTVQGFSKPIITSAISKYQEVFAEKRKAFSITYGV